MSSLDFLNRLAAIPTFGGGGPAIIDPPNPIVMPGGNSPSPLAVLAGQVPQMEQAAARVPLDASRSMVYLGGGMASAAGQPGATGASSLGAGALQLMQGEERHSEAARAATATNNQSALAKFQAMAGLTAQDERLKRDDEQFQERMGLERQRMGLAGQQYQDSRKDSAIDRMMKLAALDSDRDQQAWQRDFDERKLDVASRPKASDRQEQIRMLMQSGLSYQTAVGIATGRYKTTKDPMSGETEVIDVATGRPVDRMDPQKAKAVEMAGGAAGGVEAKGSAEATSMPRGVDMSIATGADGFFKNAGNTVAGVFGEHPFPETERAVQALTNLYARSVTVLQDAVPGKPSTHLMKMLEKLAVNPADLRQGDGRAKERLRQTRDMLATEMERIDRDILAPDQMRRYRPTDISTARLSRSQLQGLLADYDAVLESWGSGEGPKGADGGGPQPGQIEPDRNGNRYRFLGGDPSNPSSWERVP